MRREVSVMLLLLCSTIVVSFDASAINMGGEDPGVSDVPNWRVGDKWIYSGSFDPSDLIRDAGVDATVGTITGDATTIVRALNTISVDGKDTLVYEVRQSANFDKGGVQLESYTGNLLIEFQVDEVRRVSDLAKISSDLSLDVKYVPYGISSLTQEIADITISTDYDPMSEAYDFPLRIGETWNTSYISSTSWSGASDYITPFPQPTSGANHTNYEITDVGKPVSEIGEQIGYSGCNASYLIKSYDDNGTETSFEWFCPEVRSFAWLHTEEDIGLVIDFRLKQYLPVESNGVVSNENPGNRNMNLDIELSTEITALNTPVGVWANVTNSDGMPQPGFDVEIRYESTGFSTTGTTSSNGSFWAEVNVGSATDTSASSIDWSSLGIIAKSGNMLGVSTITLDENIVGLDIVASLERASILRNRSGDLSTLNVISGFDVLPGDELNIQLPVYNRGITDSMASTVTITLPDGQQIVDQLPSLKLYEQYIFEVNWTIDGNSGIDNQSIEWEVDSSLNPTDANSTNDKAEIPIFIGTAPTFVANNMIALTNEKLLIDASQSFDEDGGEVWCFFDIEYDDGTFTTAHKRILRNGCSINWTWIDDGVYEILVTLTDDEGDSIDEKIEVQILNRAPSVSIISQRDKVKVEHPVTLHVFANDSDSEEVWPGVVDVYWPNVNCKEGYYTRKCTTTAWEEGLHTFTAVGVDDDGNETYATIDIEFTNIAPHDVAVTMWDENDNLIPAEGQMTWRVDEDQVVELQARAEDSIDDLSTLRYEWSLGIETDGRTSAIPAVWQTAGMKTILVKAIDSQDSDSGWVERWVDVQNVQPIIEPLPEILPVAEGQTVTLSGNAWDTESDMEGLIICWDIDPGMDSDGIGSADDDCDIVGSDLSYSWQTSGIHNIVFHATDNDGARNSSTATVEVLNLPPLVIMNVPSNAIAGETVILDSSATIDSALDIDYLTVVWDTDCRTDSDGDGITDNDADLVGPIVEHEFPRAGKFTVKAIIWDEEVMKPSSQTAVVEVDSPDMTVFEEVMASVIGNGDNPFFQLLMISGIIALLLFVINKTRPKPKSAWDDEAPVIEAPLTAPSIDDFESTSTETPPPIPPEGLPQGWTEEQWNYYGHQYISMNESQNSQYEM